MDFKQDAQEEMLDEEWISLMYLAKQIGLTPDEIKEFLLQPK